MSDYIDKKSIDEGNDYFSLGNFHLASVTFQHALKSHRKYEGDRMHPIQITSEIVEKLEQCKSNTEKIKAELILSCIKNEPESFLPFLMSINVQTEFPNKKGFYQFFKNMLNRAHESSKGELTLKIEQPTWGIDKQKVNYNFYDNVHKYSRFTIEVKENDNLICLGIMPF
jgi:hypothetical protein